MKPKLSPAQIEQVCQDYQAGSTVKDLAKKWQASTSCIWENLKAQGVPMRPPWTRPFLSEQQLIQMAQRYLAGEHVNNLAAFYNLHHDTIIFWLKRQGVTIRPYRLEVTALPAEQVQTICQLYEKGATAQAIAAKIGISSWLVIKAINLYGPGLRSWSESHRRYTCNHHFFDEINSEETAYWAGFIAADAGISDTQNITFNLAEKDGEHLFKLRAALQSNHPIKPIVVTDKNGTYPKTYYRLSSPLMCAALARYGITPRKSFTLQWPPISPLWNADFLRGVIDGDGGYYLHYRNDRPTPQYQYQFSVSGNWEFLRQAQQILASACDLQLVKIQRTHSPKIGRLCYGGTRQVARIVHYLYDGATVYLERKYQIITPLLSR